MLGTWRASISDVNRRLIVRHIRRLLVVEEATEGKFEKAVESAVILVDIIAAAHGGVIRAQLLRIHGIKVGCVRWVLDFRYVGRFLLPHVRKVDALEEVVALDLVHALAQPLVSRRTEPPYQVRSLAG